MVGEEEDDGEEVQYRDSLNLNDIRRASKMEERDQFREEAARKIAQQEYYRQ